MKLSVGFITYNQNTYKYLPYFLPSLEKALLLLENIEVEVFVVDNSENFTDNFTYLNNFFAKSIFLNRINIIKADYNLGFSRSFNLMINKAIKGSSDLFLAINPDIVLEEESIKNLISLFLKNYENFKNISSISPKILKWDYENNEKTNYIDSLGVGMTASHRFFDIGQGKLDSDRQKVIEIFGSSGAASLYNLKALNDVAYNNGKYLEFFDELMFMYKEDVDLAYRLQIAGWKSYLFNLSVVYHDRTLGSKSNKIISLFLQKSNKLRSWSFLNQLIIIFKFKEIKFSFKIRILSNIRLFLLLIYGFIFNFKQIIGILRLRREIKKRRKKLKIKINVISDLEKIIAKA